MEFLPVKKNRGLYYDPEFEPETINLSGALAMFAPTFDELEDLKQDLAENMLDAIDTIKKDDPGAMSQAEFDAWYLDHFGVKRPELYEVFSEVRLDLRKLKIEAVTAGPQRVIKRIVQRQAHLSQPTRRQGGVTEAEIEQAREYPLEDMITNKRFKATGRWRSNYHCPLEGHAGEKTPSFYVDKNNRYKCFGCQERGDAIDFVMQRDGSKFVQAVKSLVS